MDDIILEKRKSLEDFIREQMAGPGACRNKYYYEGDDEAVNEEVLNTTPGNIYSTAILFPQRDNSSQDTIEPEPLANDDAQVDDGEEDADDDNPDETSDEVLNDKLESDEADLYSLSQRFPSSVGLSCCLKGSCALSEELKITVSGRYYTKIPKSMFGKIVIRVDDELKDAFNSFLERYRDRLCVYFLQTEYGVKLARDISADFVAARKCLLAINEEVCHEIAEAEDGSLDERYNIIRANYRYLKSYKERLWHYLMQLDKDSDEVHDIKAKIEKIEKHETFLSYLEDAINICNPRSYGFWYSHSFSHVLDLSSIDFSKDKDGNKVIYSPEDNECLRVPLTAGESLKLELSVWIQVTKPINGGDDRKYLKIQVKNTSTPFKEDASNHFSIVTEKVNQRSVFGIDLKLESESLLPYREYHADRFQEDVEQLNYLYRSIEDYAVGHFCSADWPSSGKVDWVKTEFLPSFETPDVEPVPRDKYNFDESGNPRALLDNSQMLQFKWLSLFSDASDKDIMSGLNDFAETYGNWISMQKSILGGLPGDNGIGYDNLEKCEEDCRRIKDNVLLLQTPENMLSFRLMNSAMFIQLWHGKNACNATSTFDFYRDADDRLFGNFHAAWRPFQLAFIFLNLDGIIQREDDPEWKKRNELVDLVWFPTGGGKTEAYLGLIALTIIVRRRTGSPRCGGTTAIMRYTLRLLATQQFQRAMRVILALEQIRRWGGYGLGDENTPITIGLYVGGDSLPNSAQDLLDECTRWNNVVDGRRTVSKIPLDRCPYCGERIEYQNNGTTAAPRIIFRCSNARCTFGDSLPVVLCDDDIYKYPPTLLFGTVDKFAALAHKVSSANEEKDSRRIFGRGNLDNLPPSLIIQDELHLLLGPLGSAVSLFECAIDQLCSYTTPEGHVIRPKIISSTATTRNTKLQIRALYDRELNIFPKSGIDYDDSFFSFYRRKKDGDTFRYLSKRKYLGVLPTGRTQMTTQMRLVAILFVHRALFEKKYRGRLTERDVEETMDFYHSVVDYFNSLREVGKTAAQFDTEFRKYTRRLFKKVLRFSDALECLYCYDGAFRRAELTGRLSGPDAVKSLAEVGKHWTAANRFSHLENRQLVRGTVPPDLIIATNMISVGLDVDRFNTIIMNSMPRNIAEYIQASSRVARNKPGIVITLHNPFRARDISHYERFREFHEKLYYYVDPISITPFSKKSVDRYFPLYMAAIIRHHYDALADNGGAANFDERIRAQIVQEVKEYFKRRLTRTSALPEADLRELLTDELEHYVEQFLDKALDEWQSFVTDGRNTYRPVYVVQNNAGRGGRRRAALPEKNLFRDSESFDYDYAGTCWSVPMALRNVETEAAIKIKK